MAPEPRDHRPLGDVVGDEDRRVGPLRKRPEPGAEKLEDIARLVFHKPLGGHAFGKAIEDDERRPVGGGPALGEHDVIGRRVVEVAAAFAQVIAGSTELETAPGESSRGVLGVDVDDQPAVTHHRQARRDGDVALAHSRLGMDLVDPARVEQAGVETDIGDGGTFEFATVGDDLGQVDEGRRGDVYTF